jgi:hypothetical protein
MDKKTIVILVILWVVMVVSNTLFLFLYPDVHLKKRVHPWLMCADGVIFMAFIFWLERRRMNPMYAASVVITTAVITFYNIKAIVFCERCGFTLIRIWPFPRRCPRCDKGAGRASTPGS